METFTCQWNSPEVYECDQCQFETFLKVNLHTHVRLIHEEKETKVDLKQLLEQYQCENCDFQTFSLLPLTKHNAICEQGWDETLDGTKVNSISLLPEKSRIKYISVYKAFLEWQSVNKVHSFSENVLLTYFGELSEKLKSSSLWSRYSMLRATLHLNHNINIEKYSKLRSLLKRKGKGYKPKKAEIFVADEINKFLLEAPDNTYLATKVASILGTMGVSSASELYSINIEDIQDLGSALLVTVPNPTKNEVRRFTVSYHFYQICKKYMNLRPTNPNCSTSFFLNYYNGKCSTQKIGIKKFRAMVKQMAKFLKLPNPEMYTRFSVRKSSCPLREDVGGNSAVLKEHDGWKSATPFESVENEINTGNTVLQSVQQSTSIHAQNSFATYKKTDSTSSVNVSNGIDSENEVCPPNASDASLTLPEKSKTKYEAAYKAFMDWRRSKKVNSFSEKDLLAYFRDLSEKCRSSSLRSHYSMLRSTLSMNNNINIEKYAKLRSFLKHKRKGYQAQKPVTLSTDEINRFLIEAPDNIYLATKVGAIMRTMGACRGSELHSLKFENIQDLGSTMLVTVPKPDTKTVRHFEISGHCYQICKKYIDIRPTDPKYTSFFLNYQNGKCILQRIGIHKFGNMAKQIANFLNLPNPEMYMGHSFPRLSDSLFLHADENIPAMQGSSRWRSTAATEEYVDDLIKKEADVENEIYVSIKTEGDTENRIVDLNKSEIDTAYVNLQSSRQNCKTNTTLKSKDKYEKVYAYFENWCEKNNVKVINEDVVLAYLSEKSTTLKSSSLWSQYSMLRSTLMIKKNIDVSFPRVGAFLKKKSIGYTPKKSKVFNREEIDRFLLEADDDYFLMMKVGLIVGVAGACTVEELCRISIDNIEDRNTVLIMKIERTFVVVEQNKIALYKKYVNLRPQHTPHRRLFVYYNYRKCSTQPVGVHTIGKIPSKIATFLKLPNPEEYSGHCFRRTSTLLKAEPL